MAGWFFVFLFLDYCWQYREITVGSIENYPLVIPVVSSTIPTVHNHHTRMNIRMITPSQSHRLLTFLLPLFFFLFPSAMSSSAFWFGSSWSSRTGLLVSFSITIMFMPFGFVCYYNIRSLQKVHLYFNILGYLLTFLSQVSMTEGIRR